MVGSVAYAAVLPASASLLTVPTTAYLNNFYPFATLGTAGRKKRDIGSDFSISAFDAAQYYGDMEAKVSNFTCVMKAMELLTPTGAINTALFSAPFTPEGSKAAADPVFVGELTAAFSNCYTLSQVFPQVK